MNLSIQKSFKVSGTGVGWPNTQTISDFYILWFQIESRKLEWNTGSKIGSLDNAKHKPGGGQVKVSEFDR